MTEIEEIISTIEVQLIANQSGDYEVRNLDNEIIKSFAYEDFEEADKFFKSYLTEEQIEALRIEIDISNELRAEAEANRQLSY